MKEHTVENDIWNEGQLGAVAGVLGTVNQLIIDKSIMEEVKTYQENHFMTIRKHMIKSTVTGYSEYISGLEYQGV